MLVGYRNKMKEKRTWNRWHCTCAYHSTSHSSDPISMVSFTFHRRRLFDSQNIPVFFHFCFTEGWRGTAGGRRQMNEAKMAKTTAEKSVEKHSEMGKFLSSINRQFVGPVSVEHFSRSLLDLTGSPSDSQIDDRLFSLAFLSLFGRFPSILCQTITVRPSTPSLCVYLCQKEQNKKSTKNSIHMHNSHFILGGEMYDFRQPIYCNYLQFELNFSWHQNVNR